MCKRKKTHFPCHFVLSYNPLSPFGRTDTDTHVFSCWLCPLCLDFKLNSDKVFVQSVTYEQNNLYRGNFLSTKQKRRGNWDLMLLVEVELFSKSSSYYIVAAWQTVSKVLSLYKVTFQNYFTWLLSRILSCRKNLEYHTHTFFSSSSHQNFKFDRN